MAEIAPSDSDDYLSDLLASFEVAGGRQTIDLVIGYNKANVSPTLKLFLSRVDAL